MANRTDPTRRHLTDEKRRRLHLYTSPARRASGWPSGSATSSARPVQWTHLDDRGLAAQQVQSVLDGIQNPSTFIFHITNPIGNFLVQYCLTPFSNFFVDAVAGDGVRPRRDRLFRLRVAALR